MGAGSSTGRASEIGGSSTTVPTDSCASSHATVSAMVRALNERSLHATVSAP